MKIGGLGDARQQLAGLGRPDDAHRLVARGLRERAVLRLIRMPLEDGQFNALCSFAFNLGAGALQRSRLRRKVNREEHDAVPQEFRRWVWAGGRKLKGLMAAGSGGGAKPRLEHRLQLSRSHFDAAGWRNF